ncbi:MAG: metallophosphoesterase [Blautia sp.]|jgi:predicted MPP superfamily phosphohydrolase
MRDFRWKTYELTSPKLKKESGRVRFCFLSDLHGSSFGENYIDLIDAIKSRRPDGILVGGDMMVSSHPDFSGPQALLTELGNICPVWYALGNHEYRLMQWPWKYGEGYAAYEKSMAEAGVHFLHNTSGELTVRDSRFRIYGLELEMAFFRKPHAPYLKLAHMQKLLRMHRAAGEPYTILLAHNPKYAKTYFQWGADLTLSGHYHGGILRFNEHHGLVAPQAPIFPKYCCGDFYQKGKAIVVSAGLGEHTLPIRIHNPREVIEIVIHG